MFLVVAGNAALNSTGFDFVSHGQHKLQQNQCVGFVDYRSVERLLIGLEMPSKDIRRDATATLDLGPDPLDYWTQ